MVEGEPRTNQFRAERMGGGEGGRRGRDDRPHEMSRRRPSRSGWSCHRSTGCAVEAVEGDVAAWIDAVREAADGETVSTWLDRVRVRAE